MDERRYWWGRNPLGFPCPIGTVGLWTKGGIGGAGNPLGFPCPVGTVGQEGLWTQDCICGTMNSMHMSHWNCITGQEGRSK